LKGDKGGDFSDFSFKEGTTQTVKLQEIFIQEKGKDALKKLSESDLTSSAAPRVKGGAKRKVKAASKSKGKAGKKSAPEPSGEVSKRVEKLLKYTPSKSAEKKQSTPQKSKSSARKPSVSKAKHTPAMPSPGGKKSKPVTTD
jgi:hypothetical protein